MRSLAIGKLTDVDGSRPYCTPDGVGAVLAVFYTGSGYHGAITQVPTTITSPDRRQLYLGLGAYMTTGVIGQASVATAAEGQAALQRLAENSGKIVRTLNETSTDR